MKRERAAYGVRAACGVRRAVLNGDPSGFEADPVISGPWGSVRADQAEQQRSDSGKQHESRVDRIERFEGITRGEIPCDALSGRTEGISEKAQPIRPRRSTVALSDVCRDRSGSADQLCGDVTSMNASSGRPNV